MVGQLTMDSRASTDGKCCAENIETEIASHAIPTLGECLETRPNVSDSPVRIRWTEPSGAVTERWLPILRQVAVREGDRVLLLHPAGWPTLLVAGVINGFRRRPEPARQTIQSIELKADEAAVIVDHEGKPLVELARSAKGLLIRPMSPDVDFHVPGTLQIRANHITMEAERGDVRLRASDCVVAEGELIKLN